MKLDQILATVGKAKAPRRIGRGTGSGRGKTSGRGHRGYGARSGAGKLLGFEGGQNPVFSRIPKRGFSNAMFRTDYQIVNVAALDRFKAGTRVDAQVMKEARLIHDLDKPVKLLGGGELKKKLTVVANRFSTSAAKKITDAGGTVEQL